MKSIKLKTEDMFCLTFIWLITSYQWTCYSDATVELYSFFCLCFLILSFSSSFFSSSFFLLNFPYLPILLPTLTACSSSEGTNLSLQCYQKALLLLEVNITYQLYVSTSQSYLQCIMISYKDKKTTCCFRIGKKGGGKRDLAIW